MADTIQSLKNILNDKRILYLALAPVVTILFYFFDIDVASLIFSRLFPFLAIGVFKVSFLGKSSAK